MCDWPSSGDAIGSACSRDASLLCDTGVSIGADEPAGGCGAARSAAVMAGRAIRFRRGRDEGCGFCRGRDGRPAGPASRTVFAFRPPEERRDGAFAGADLPETFRTDLDRPAAPAAFGFRRFRERRSLARFANAHSSDSSDSAALALAFFAAFRVSLANLRACRNFAFAARAVCRAKRAAFASTPACARAVLTAVRASDKSGDDFMVAFWLSIAGSKFQGFRRHYAPALAG